MTRRSFFEPRGSLTADLVFDALLLGGVETEREALEAWTEIELLIAYDWAIREHLHASDNAVRRRAKPSFVGRMERAGVECHVADFSYGDKPR